MYFKDEKAFVEFLAIAGYYHFNPKKNLNPKAQQSN